MDNPGWHAQRRAQKENDRSYRDSLARRGFPLPFIQSQDIAPIEEGLIGGDRWSATSPRPPPLPPKDPQHWPPDSQIRVTSSQLAKLSAVERSRVLRALRMDPHLQLVCGPLLKYDTVDERGIWRGAVLIVSSVNLILSSNKPSLTYSISAADPGSVYDPLPTLTYSWNPDPSVVQESMRKDSSAASRMHRRTESNVSNGHTKESLAQSFELGPHPADPHSTILPASPSVSKFDGPSFTFSPPVIANAHMASATQNGFLNCSETASGQEIWVYCGTGGTFTFWRFLIRIPLAQKEMTVHYSINNGQHLDFWVPGKNQNMRWATYSCNGFTPGINPDDFRGPGFNSGYDPLWMDLLVKHSQKPFHCLVGGGDQLYCDLLLREPEMQDWINKSKPEEKKVYPLTAAMGIAIDRFFFHHYCQSFRSGAFARANCSIPMLNMCDDHDIIDGFGSYPDDLQMSPVFRQIGARGYFFFLLFQCFINVEIDGIQDAPGKHVYQSVIIGDPGPYVRFPSHSFLTRLGPEVFILLLDCRAERRKEQVCSTTQYKRVFERMNALPQGIDHIVMQLAIPIAYPRLVFLEAALESKLNPLVALGRNGSLGLSSFVNRFNAEAELLDDLNDHWNAKCHKKERNWFVEQLQHFARVKRIRVSFLSGDVHCSAVGCFFTLKRKGKTEVRPIKDFRYMVNIVTSAIVNAPPPIPVLSLVSSLATKMHKTLHPVETDEIMIPVFSNEPNGQSRKQKYIMGRRNWCQVELDERNHELLFDIRVEMEKGYGDTFGYAVRVPPPRWD